MASIHVEQGHLMSHVCFPKPVLCDRGGCGKCKHARDRVGGLVSASAATRGLMESSMALDVRPDIVQPGELKPIHVFATELMDCEMKRHKPEQ